MLANYYDSQIEPEISNSSTKIHQPVTITHSGTQPTVKVGGNFKVFTPVFEDDDVKTQEWTICDEDGAIIDNAGDYIIKYDGNKMKLKIAQKYELVGKVLIVKVKGADGSEGELRIEVVA